MADYLTAHACEGHRVEVLLVAHLYAAEVKAHDGGVVATEGVGV